MIDEYAVPTRQQLFIPALEPVYRKLAPYGYSFMRVLLGVVLIPGGIDKLFNGGVGRIAAGNVVKAGFEPAWFWAWLVGGLEFFGAMLIVVGLWTRPVAFMLTIQMIVITWRIRGGDGFFVTAKGGGMEVSMVLLVMCIAVLAGGGGRWSLDRKIGREF
jgi:putative oxidoreductase